MPNSIETTDAVASTGTSYALGIGQTAQGKLASSADQDWYRVNLIAGQTYTFAVAGTGALDSELPTLALRNGAGTLLAYDEFDGPGYNSSITFTATATGAYFLDVGSFGTTDGGQYGISTVLGTKAFYDEKMAAGALVRENASWSSNGTPATVTWGVRATLSDSRDSQGLPAEFFRLSAAQIASINAGLSQYSEVANIKFTQVNPGGTTDNAKILVSAYTSVDDPAGAYAYLPGDYPEAGDIRLNNRDVSTSSLPQGDYSAYTILHEIGHAVGLDHPSDYNADGQEFIYKNAAMFIQDDHQYTVMSYFDESSTTGSYNSYPDTLMLHDILAVQQLYGANMSTRAGNTVYGFGSNAGATYNFAVNTNPALSIWDGGGTDTINASGFHQNQLINLNDGTFSNIGGLRGNISIAFNAIIENAIGGRGADNLAGNEYNNTLNGGAGADLMQGGRGNDRYNVDNSSDRIVEANVTGVDHVYSTATYSILGQFIENLTLMGSTNISGIGNSLANVITGNAGKNTLSGGLGNDKVNGGANADHMIGGAGNDSYYFDNVGDIADESVSGSVGVDKIYSSIGLSLSNTKQVKGGIEHITLMDSGDINAAGNTLNNDVTGNSGNNSLYGQNGNDVLSGGLGNDTLYGGAASDRFMFNTAPNVATNIDKIADFNVLNDTILLDNAIFAALGNVGVLATEMFWKSTTGLAHSGADRITYEIDTGKLFYDSNGSGVGQAVQFAALNPNLALTNADFLIV